MTFQVTPSLSQHRDDDRSDSAEPRTEITERQLECLAWTREGKSATDIGLILGISGRTVEGHLAKLCQHLGVRTRIQAVIKASELGLLRRWGR